MPASTAKTKTPKTTPDSKQTTRLWLTYPTKLIKEPVLWQLAKKFPVVTNIRQAGISNEIGILTLELDGKRSDIKSAIKWLEKQGVKVEPVEINVIES